MQLERALKLAEQVVKRLSPYCSRIEIAGSIRRKKPQVRDIDIVLISSDPWNLEQEVLALARPFQPKVSGEKLKRFSINGVQIDLYYATEQTWATLLLIRTGSTEFNRMLAGRAIERGLHLAANGRGVMKGSNIIGSKSEEEILEVLGLHYIEPCKREINQL